MANYISKRGANVAPSYATLGDLPSSTEVGDLVFVAGQLGIAVSASGYQTCDKTDIVFPYDWTTTTQQAKLQASDAAYNDQFGFENGMIDGDTIVVGAHFDQPSGNGSHTQPGAAYVFTRSGTTWSQQAKLVASDPEAGDRFGSAAAISGDTIVIGAKLEDAVASAAGAAYVFTRSGTTWSQQAKITASDGAVNDLFGTRARIAGDTIVIGAQQHNSRRGAAYIFTRSGTTWSQQAKLTASDAAANDNFGSSVNISADTVVVGAYAENSGAGAAYVFTRSGTSWSQQAKLTASDRATNDYFGNTGIGISGDTVAVGARVKPYSGYVYKGAAYVFTRSGTSWSQQAKLLASDAQNGDFFGSSIDITGDTIIVGAEGEDTGASGAGAAYIFTRSGTSWTQAKKIQASDAGADDYFGNFVGISGNTVLVTAYGEDTGSSDAGAAYTFLAG
jgi:hypothetical protein